MPRFEHWRVKACLAHQVFQHADMAQQAPFALFQHADATPHRDECILLLSGGFGQPGQLIAHHLHDVNLGILSSRRHAVTRPSGRYATGTQNKAAECDSKTLRGER